MPKGNKRGRGGLKDPEVLLAGGDDGIEQEALPVDQEARCGRVEPLPGLDQEDDEWEWKGGD